MDVEEIEALLATLAVWARKAVSSRVSRLTCCLYVSRVVVDGVDRRSTSTNDSFLLLLTF